MWDRGEKQCVRTVVEGCGEGGRDELCIKRQTQKQDERGEMGCGREQTARVLTLVTTSIARYQSWDAVKAARGAAGGLTGWLSR